MELFIFGRFHAREGQQDAVAAAMREVVGPTRARSGRLPGDRAVPLDPRSAAVLHPLALGRRGGVR